MEWTTEEPVTEGWYWVWHSSRPTEISMMQVYRSTLQSVGQLRGCCFSGDRLIKNWRGVVDMWAGPIPEPEDSDEVGKEAHDANV